MDFNNLKNVVQREPFYILNAFSVDYLEEITNHVKNTTDFQYNNGNTYSQDPTIPERKIWEIRRDEKTDEFINIITKYINKANQQYQFDLIKLLQLGYFEYSSEDTTPLDWHIDLGNEYPFNTRKLSFSIMVNSPSEYKGGNLEMAYAPTNTTIPKHSGGMVLFPSFLPHRVTALTKGIRKSIVGFVGGRPFR
jgi:hypothetical protein